MTETRRIRSMIINTDKSGKKRMQVCQISKAEFANLIEGEIRKCLEIKSPLGTLAIIYSAIDSMAGTGQFADWIDTYFPYMPPGLSGKDFWGSRNNLFHRLDIHSEKRDKRGKKYTPLVFHWDESHENKILIISPDWKEGDPLLDLGTTFIILEKFVDVFIKGMNKWAGESGDLSRFVFPILT